MLRRGALWQSGAKRKVQSAYVLAFQHHGPRAVSNVVQNICAIWNRWMTLRPPTAFVVGTPCKITTSSLSLLKTFSKAMHSGTTSRKRSASCAIKWWHMMTCDDYLKSPPRSVLLSRVRRLLRKGPGNLWKPLGIPGYPRMFVTKDRTAGLVRLHRDGSTTLRVCEGVVFNGLLDVSVLATGQRWSKYPKNWMFHDWKLPENSVDLGPIKFWPIPKRQLSRNHKMTREPSQGPFSQLAFETGPALPRLAACNRLHASLGLPRLVSNTCQLMDLSASWSKMMRIPTPKFLWNRILQRWNWPTWRPLEHVSIGIIGPMNKPFPELTCMHCML